VYAGTTQSKPFYETPIGIATMIIIIGVAVAIAVILKRRK